MKYTQQSLETQPLEKHKKKRCEPDYASSLLLKTWLRYARHSGNEDFIRSSQLKI